MIGGALRGWFSIKILEEPLLHNRIDWRKFHRALARAFFLALLRAFLVFVTISFTSSNSSSVGTGGAERMVKILLINIV
jgi:hypothetical protein